jgi:DNA-binding response OmpR family regulator
MADFLQQLWRFVRRQRGLVPGPQAHGPAAVPGSAKVVLIIDLDGRVGQLLAQSLEKAGFVPHVASRGNGALELLGRAAPAVAIVVGPADLDFYRALRRATSAPILALDPQAGDEQVLGAFAAGVDQFQARPTSHDEIVARVQALLRRATNGKHP